MGNGVQGYEYDALLWINCSTVIPLLHFHFAVILFYFSGYLVSVDSYMNLQVYISKLIFRCLGALGLVATNINFLLSL